MHSYVKVTVRADFCILVALSLFVFPIQWVFGWIIAAFVHELFHLLMMLILKVNVFSVSLRASGTIIESNSMTSFQELLCAIAGPLGGLTIMLLKVIFPPASVCAAVQTVYNLLPIYPLDGGRAVKCAAACMFGDKKAEIISKVISILCFASIYVVVIIYLLPYAFTYKNFLQCR